MRIDCSITENYFKEKNRMTKSDNNNICAISCSECPLSRYKNDRKLNCIDFENLCTKEAIAIVQAWSDANPRETIFEHLKKEFPNLIMSETIKGLPATVCPSCFGYKKLCTIKGFGNEDVCRECWAQPYEEAGDE